MKKFILYLSVNGGEYCEEIRMYGDKCVIGECFFEDDCYRRYPVYLDDKRIDFQEPVSFNYENI